MKKLFIIIRRAYRSSLILILFFVTFLLSKRNDASEAVRITVLHVLGKMKPAEAIPILLEMSHDQAKVSVMRRKGI